MEYQLSNSYDDRIIKLINNSQNSTDKNLLPKSTKEGLDTKVVKEIDHRLCEIPRYPGLIILKNSLENISKFTANDYRNIIKVIIFVTDNLYKDYKEEEIPCERLCNMFCLYLKMYMKLHQESFMDIELAELQVYITEFCQEFVTIFYDYSSSHCRIPKLYIQRQFLTSKQTSQDDDIHHLYKEGFNNLYAGFDEFLVKKNITYNDEFGYFKIYLSVAVESTDIIRIAGNFHNYEWFSNVVVSSEENDWYGRIQ
ncbi:16622_t:CDS:2 [Funneliformis geosporum]|nr:16622_t:CDS:2 [Funneliformis geosporum]